jgi:hypothetical protein
MFLPLEAKDWFCGGGHMRVLFRHPRTGLRKLGCPDCDAIEIVNWLSDHDPNTLKLSEADIKFLKEIRVNTDDVGMSLVEVLVRDRCRRSHRGPDSFGRSLCG